MKKTKKVNNDGVFKYIFELLKRKTELQHKLKTKKKFKETWKLKDMVGETPNGPTIYGNMPRGQAIKEEYIFHTWFKYKFIEPLLLLIDKMFSKHIHVDLSGRHNKNLRIFSESWEESIKTWTTEFTAFQNGKMNTFSKKQLKLNLNNMCQRLFRIAKNFGVWMAYKDTVIREFLNIFMHEMSVRMQKEYGGRQIKHWYYSTQNVYNPMYFHIWGKYQHEEDFAKMSPDQQEQIVMKELEDLNMKVKEKQFEILQIRNKRQMMLESDEFKIAEALSNVRLKKKLNSELLKNEYMERIIQESVNIQGGMKNEIKETNSGCAQTGIEDRTRIQQSTSDNESVSREVAVTETIKDIIPETKKTRDNVKHDAEHHRNINKRINSKRKK
jgi:hypothetical protein